MNAAAPFRCFRPAPFPRLRVAVPFVEGLVCAGFPSPADDHLQQPIDLNELFIRNPPATFLVRVTGESMLGAHIHDGDLIVVDRSLLERNGDIVLACIDGEFTIKRLRRRAGRTWLQPENPAFPAIELNEAQDCTVWGVVTGCLRTFRQG